MAAIIGVSIDGSRFDPVFPLWDDDLCPALSQFILNPVDVEGFVGEEATKCDVLDEWRDADRVVVLARHQDEVDEIA